MQIVCTFQGAVLIEVKKNGESPFVRVLSAAIRVPFNAFAPTTLIHVMHPGNSAQRGGAVG